MNTRVDSIQLVLFSPGIVIFDVLKAGVTIREKYLNVLDGEPVILPIPDDAPVEIPRIQMSSKDKTYSLSISKNRVDLILRYKKDELSNVSPFQELFENFLSLFQYLKNELNAKVTRLAIVTHWVIELDGGSSAEHLLSKYINKEAPIARPRELEIHCLNRETLSDFEANKWTRIRSAHDISLPHEDRLISFLLDINTLAENTYDFKKESIQAFLEESVRIMKNTLESHLSLLGG